MSPAGRTAAKVGWWILGVAVFVVAASIVAGVSLAHVDQKWVACEVHSAAAGGQRGENWVSISTSCGQLRYGSGVTSSAAAEKLAGEFTANAEYEFKLGWTARVIEMRWPVLPPEVQAWRKAQ